MQVGTLALIAGSGLVLAQADNSAANPMLNETVEVGMGVAGLPEAIAGPFGLGGKAYYLLEPSTWEQGEQAAVANYGAHLVTINDATENSFVRNSVLDFDGNGRNGWLGLTDRDVEGDYVWMNNEPVGYTNWSPGGEPNGGTNENYAAMLDGFPYWYDLQNNWGDLFTPVYGIVELDIPETLAGPFYYEGHTYYLLDESNHHQADAAARLLGGHLVTMDNAAENSWVRSNVVEFDGVGRHSWLGLTDTNFEGIYRWDNDSLATYLPWFPNEPNGGASQNYIIMWNNSTLWFDGAYNWSTGVFGIVEVATPNPCAADLNNDGQLNFFDVSEFLSVFGAGCP
jgi:hypothetical protein